MMKTMVYTLQVAPEDCTGCALCVEVCPAKNKQEIRLKAINMAPQPPLREPEKENWEFLSEFTGAGSPRGGGTYGKRIPDPAAIV